MRAVLSTLFWLGRPLSPLYSALMRLRAWCYRRNFVLQSKRIEVPVISVGNLTMGGSGKTPMVLYLGRLLGRLGRRPAIVSRGYGVRVGEVMRVVADGKSVFLGPEQAGDEPVMLAGRLPGVPVLVGPKRLPLAQRAVSDFAADLIIMDDGFQHLGLARDIDLVLFAANNLLGSGWVFPGGELREPFSALGRADAFVITGIDDDNREAVARLCRRLGGAFPLTPVFLGEYRPVSLLDGADGGEVPVGQAAGKRFYGFAGIAAPESFRRTLCAHGFQLAGFRSFRDHHPYCDADLCALIESARAAGAEALLTTEKDFVKIQRLRPSFPVFALRIDLRMGEEFDGFLADALRRLG